MNNALAIKQLAEMRGPKLFPAYLLWFFIGGFGAHQFYLRNTTYGAIYIAVAIASLLSGGALLPIFGIMLIIDIFTIPMLARKAKARIENELTVETAVLNAAA